MLAARVGLALPIAALPALLVVTRPAATNVMLDSLLRAVAGAEWY